jgi:hypothetical protein
VANSDPDYPSAGYPIRKFLRVENSRLTDALNTLINDVNVAIPLGGGGGGGGGAPYEGAFTVAALPAGTEGQTAYATNGRKIGEGSSAGSGVYVYYSLGFWRVFSTDAPVLS